MSINSMIINSSRINHASKARKIQNNQNFILYEPYPSKNTVLLYTQCMNNSTWLSKIFSRIGFTHAKNVNTTVTADGLWQKCTSCNNMILKEIINKNLHVCNCGYHFKISVMERIQQVFDDGYTLLESDTVCIDPIQFTDLKAYKDRFTDAKKKTNANEAFQIIDGNIDGNRCIGIIMDFDFIGGSMGIAVGEAIKVGAEMAIANKLPFIIFTASGGARMQEGLFSLMQMPKTTIAVERLKAHHLPFITVLTHPTTGGVLASFAMRGSITIAEPNAIIGFTGARVIESVMKVKLPKNFQTPEFVQEKGFIDHVVQRKNLKEFLGKILRILSNNTTDTDKPI